MENAVLKYLTEHAHDFILRDELTTIIKISVAVVGVIVTVINGLMFKAIGGLMAKKEIQIMEKVIQRVDQHKEETDTAKEKLREETKEIKDNYLKRFDEIRNELHKVQESVVRIETTLKYIVNRDDPRI